EYACAHLRRHAVPGVRDGDFHEVGTSALFCFRLDVFCGDGDGAAIDHGVASVQAQIQDRELELSGVQFDGPDAGCEFDHDFDVAAERSVEHAAHAFEVRPDIDRLRVYGVTPRERKQPAG